MSTAIGGREAGTLFEGDRRFDIVVRLPERLRGDLDALERLPIRAAQVGNAARASFMPLGEVATLQVAPGPNQISREDGKRRIVVSANVRGRDLGSFVAEAQARWSAEVKIPAGYWTSWGGTFENLQSATQRLHGGSCRSHCCWCSRCCSRCSATCRTGCSCSPASRSR